MPCEKLMSTFGRFSTLMILTLLAMNCDNIDSNFAQKSAETKPDKVATPPLPAKGLSISQVKGVLYVVPKVSPKSSLLITEKEATTPAAMVPVYLAEDKSIQTTTDANGAYTLIIPAEFINTREDSTIELSLIGVYELEGTIYGIKLRFNLPHEGQSVDLDSRNLVETGSVQGKVIVVVEGDALPPATVAKLVGFSGMRIHETTGFFEFTGVPVGIWKLEAFVNESGYEQIKPSLNSFVGVNAGQQTITNTIVLSADANDS